MCSIVNRINGNAVMADTNGIGYTGKGAYRNEAKDDEEMGFHKAINVVRISNLA